VILIDEASNETIEQDYEFKISGIVHPVTYVNKVLLYSHENLVLVNAISNKVLYSFQKFLNSVQENDQQITVVSPSPLVDIVGVGFDSGLISFLNLRKDQAVFSVKQKMPVTALAFSSEQSWMASGDDQGNVILWDL
jgi:WD40 repeat protein